MNFTPALASRIRMLAGISLLGLLAACSTIDRGNSPNLVKDASWAVLPFENHTETPMAGNRAESIATALLQARGVNSVKRYTGNAQQETLFDGQNIKRREDALAWARSEGVRYALLGAVDEWRYKVGVDGEPAVGVALEIVDINEGKTIWSGTGGKSGWSREALAAVGQKLIRDLLGTGIANAR
ncbi:MULTISPECIES: penicillin-binding protein activator LpoB [unclassified Comamonas]|uniref:penicillin-binding protein activator LpoB n=1 Tax=unclassified Comamonas TaxID=2638500 RepID=UPI000EAB9CAF|nr:penicillin-binding protein activator LpoB [Comamonas sp. lk]